MQLYVSQVNFLFMFQVSVSLILISCPVFTYGQAGQSFPHLAIPLTSLFGYLLGAGGTFDLIKISLIFLCFLKAVKGGSLKTSSKYLSWYFMDLQCLACIVCIAGSLGSYFRQNTGQFLTVFLVFTFRSAIFLGICYAFVIAESMFIPI